VPPLYNDPEYGRQRANEARDLARRMTDPAGMAAMLEIADKYDGLARHAIERLAQSGRQTRRHRNSRAAFVAFLTVPYRFRWFIHNV